MRYATQVQLQLDANLPNDVYLKRGSRVLGLGSTVWVLGFRDWGLFFGKRGGFEMCDRFEVWGMGGGLGPDSKFKLKKLRVLESIPKIL